MSLHTYLRGQPKLSYHWRTWCYPPFQLSCSHIQITFRKEHPIAFFPAYSTWLSSLFLLTFNINSDFHHRTFLVAACPQDLLHIQKRGDCLSLGCFFLSQAIHSMKIIIKLCALLPLTNHLNLSQPPQMHLYSVQKTDTYPHISITVLPMCSVHEESICTVTPSSHWML